MNVLQRLSDAGLNPFAAELLAESLLQHPQPVPVAFLLPVRRAKLPDWDGVWFSLHPLPVNAPDRPTLLKDMTEPQLSAHLTEQLDFIRFHQTPDTLGSLLVIFGDNGIGQYGATVDPERMPAALRELADRIERRETVPRDPNVK